MKQNPSQIISYVSPYTMLSKERLLSNIELVKNVCETNIPGDIVEIGVWKGGSILSMMLASENQDTSNSRIFHLFDTFEGMTEWNVTLDRRFDDLEPAPFLVDSNNCTCSLEDVKKNIARFTTIQPQYHVGDIRKNTQVPDSIAILRLDTDWQDSTKYELETFYPNVSPGGYVIIDDQGYWKGSRKATDEFLAAHPEISTPMVIDSTGIFFRKPLIKN